MKQFKVKMHHIVDFIVDVDESFWTEKDLERYSKQFSQVDSLQDLLKIVTKEKVRDGIENKRGIKTEIISGDYDYKITEIE